MNLQNCIAVYEYQVTGSELLIAQICTGIEVSISAFIETLKFSTKVPSHKCKIAHKASASIFHIDTLLGGTGILSHVKVNVLKRGSLSNLPMNGTDVCILISACPDGLPVPRQTEPSHTTTLAAVAVHLPLSSYARTCSFSFVAPHERCLII